MSELGPETKRLLLLVGSVDDPTEADQERIRHALQVSLGAGVLAGAGTALASEGAAALQVAGSAGTLGIKTTSLSQIVLWFGVGAATGVGLSVSGLPDPSPKASSAVSSRAAATAARALVSPRHRAPLTPLREPAAESSPQPTPAHALPAGTHSPPSATATTPPAGSVPAVAPLEVAPSAAQFTDSEANAFSEEVRLLDQAQQARAVGRCDLALLRLAEYGGRFPRGALKSESIAAEVLCLCELGRSAEAEARARGLIAAEPQSALVRRLLASCVGSGNASKR